MDAKKEARRQYMRDYYARNKEKFRPKTQEKRDQYNAARKERYATDPDAQLKARAAATAWSAANPEKRKSQRVKKYGITGDDYDRMLAEQNGCCAICGSSNSGDSRGGRFHVDHCHASGIVRGLLCIDCNHGVGKFRDSESRLQSAIEYLRRFTTAQGPRSD